MTAARKSRSRRKRRSRTIFEVEDFRQGCASVINRCGILTSMAISKQIAQLDDPDLDRDLAFIRKLKGSRPDVRPLTKEERDRLAERFFREKGL